MQAFSDPYFRAYGQNHIRIFPYLDSPNTGKYGYDSAHIREDTDHRKPVLQHISRSERIGVES